MTYNNRTRIYPFTNENLDGYMPELCKNAKSALTVSASGDQTITASMNGVNDIWAFDYVKNELFWTELKLRAMENFNQNDFRDFFQHKRKFLDVDMFNSFADKLDANCGDFWKKQYKVHGKEIAQMEGFVSLRTETADDMLGNVPYLKSDDTYKRARESLNELDLTLLHSNVAGLPKLVGDKKFDVCFLSNIAMHYPQDYKETFKSDFAPLFRNAKKIQTDYHWNTDTDWVESRKSKDYKIRGYNTEIKFFGQSPFAYNVENHKDYATIVERKQSIIDLLFS